MAWLLLLNLHATPCTPGKLLSCTESVMLIPHVHNQMNKVDPRKRTRLGKEVCVFLPQVVRLPARGCGFQEAMVVALPKVCLV